VLDLVFDYVGSGKKHGICS